MEKILLKIYQLKLPAANAAELVSISVLVAVRPVLVEHAVSMCLGAGPMVRWDLYNYLDYHDFVDHSKKLLKISLSVLNFVLLTFGGPNSLGNEKSFTSTLGGSGRGVGFGRAVSPKTIFTRQYSIKAMNTNLNN